MQLTSSLLVCLQRLPSCSPPSSATDNVIHGQLLHDVCQTQSVTSLSPLVHDPMSLLSTRHQSELLKLQAVE
jgi:hypothetical protein